MPPGANRNEAHGLPATAARRVVGPGRVQIEPAHLAGPGVAIPAGEALRGDIQHGVGRAGGALPDMAEIRRRAKAVHVEQRGQTRLDALELGPVLARHQTEGLVPAHEPMVEAAHDMGHAATIRVEAPRAERRDELANANLLVCHGVRFLAGWPAERPGRRERPGQPERRPPPPGRSPD